MSFKVGDIVVGRKEKKYINEYIITTAKNNFVGKVVNVLDDIDMEVEVISCNKTEYIGETFIVEQECFEIKKDNLTTLRKIKSKGM